LTDFREDLEFSKKYDKQFDLFYKNKLGSEIFIERPDFGQRQKNGVDAEVTFPNGERKTIEQKLRKSVWNDTAIEFCSVQYINEDTCHKSGWIYTISADLLCYAYLNERNDEITCMLYPVYFLKKAWLKNEEKWKSHFPVRAGRTHNKNGGLQYQSYFCAVPNYTLERAISDEQKIKVIVDLNQPSLASFMNLGS
jgi:hypothetical protein